MHKGIRIITKFSVSFVLLNIFSFPVNSAPLSDIEKLGKFIFFDTRLSVNKNQSCASCHSPEVGWTGPEADLNAHGAVYEGSIETRFGARKPPSSAYATQSPILHYVKKGKRTIFVGGNFWDGRATGEKLGNPAADQAQGPFLNPVEQALPDAACVIYRVCMDEYDGITFDEAWPGTCSEITLPNDIEENCAKDDSVIKLDTPTRDKVNIAYDKVALSIAAYEDSTKVNQFSSKFDYYLAGKVKLSREERRGLALFRGKGKCDNCHVIGSPGAKEPPLFTDYTYDNLGVPRNPENPWYTMPETFNPDGYDWLDKGLGGFLESHMDYAQFAPQNYGKHKIPTLRNVDARPDPEFVKAYSHNGYFKSLKSIVHFYNTRDVKPTCQDPLTTEADALAMDCWPEPEISVNLNTQELGNLHLSDKEEDAIVAFLKTLTDGFSKK